MTYVVNTIHGQGFSRIFVPDNFMINDVDRESIKNQGFKIVTNGFEILNRTMKNTAYDNLSIADVALFYVEFWADKINIELPDNCRVHYENMLKRPLVKRVLQEEGYY